MTAQRPNPPSNIPSLYPLPTDNDRRIMARLNDIDRKLNMIFAKLIGPPGSTSGGPD